MRQTTLPPIKAPTLSSLEFNSLHSFYNCTNGPDWRWTNISDLSVPWNFSIPHVNPCTSHWQGLSCSCSLTSCTVQRIILEHHNLTGSLSDSITNFANIEVFDLRFNNVGGSLPRSLGNLAKLSNLDFSYNNLTGTIPSSIEYCQSLETLSLNYNYLGGELPPALFSLKELEGLALAGNKFIGAIPEEIGNLTSLRTLQLFYNEFSGSIPVNIGKLQSLEQIDLSANHGLSGTIPDSLYSCLNLSSITITVTNITGTISEKISQLRNLLQLALTENHLYGTIPESIGQLTQLEGLELGANYALFGTIPSSIINLQKLHSLFLEYNGFYGNVTTIAEGFPELAALFLHGNLFTGEYPMALAQFKRLEYLDISENLFSGLIPWHENTTTNLNVYECFDNYFTGVLPMYTAQISYLIYYVIRQNYLTGTIVPSLFSLSKTLYYLDLSYNLFSGSIPSTLGLKTSINQLLLGGNYLTGTIPTSLTQIPRLIVLQLNNNRLIGSVPSNLTRMPFIEELFLQNNQLTGCTNSFFEHSLSTPHFSGIDFSGNSFTGTLPASFFRNASNLQSFAMSTNCLTGSIPNEICLATKLVSLSLDGLNSAPRGRNTIFSGIPYFNGFTVDEYIQGTIPACLFELEAIQTLHLSGNGLMGTIPSTSSYDDSVPLSISLTLQDLSLSHNLLVGTIPDMFQSYRWYDLDLSYNKFSGTVSSAIFDYYIDPLHPASISLEVNRLSGTIPNALLTTQNISILDGNIFQCNQLDSQNRGLPVHDADYDTYSCGSDSVDNVLYTWIVVAVLVPVLLLMSQLKMRQKTVVADSSQNDICNSSFVSRSYQSLKANLSTLKLYRLNHLIKMPNKDETIPSLSLQLSLLRLSMYFQEIRSVVLVLLAYSVVILTPVYIGLKQYYSSYSDEYTWTLSGMLLSGRVPAIVIFIFFFLFAVCFMILTQRFHARFSQTQPKDVNSATQKQQDNLHGNTNVDPHLEHSISSRYLLPNRTEAIIVYCFVSLVNLLVMCSSDFSYVYIVLNSTALFGALAAFALAIFRILTNSVLIKVALPLTTKLLRKMREKLRNLTTSPSPSSTFSHNFMKNAEYSSRDISFLENLILFNNIIIPGIAIVFILPDCFYNALFAASEVQSTYYYENCAQYVPELDLGHSCRFVLVSVPYTPSFIYTYQCSSKIVMNYVPVYIILFLLSGFLIPAVEILLKVCYDHAKKRLSQAQMLEGVEQVGGVPEINKKVEDLQTNRTSSRAVLLLKNSKELVKWKRLKSLLERFLPNHFKQFHSKSKHELLCSSSFVSSSLSMSASLPDDSKNFTTIPPKLFSKVELTVQINSFLTILMCFGALFPPLAVIAGISICSFTYYEEGCMVWVLKKTRELGEEYRWYEDELSKEFEGVEKSSKVTVWSTLIVSCSLYGYIVFDTMGDTAGWLTALPLTLVMLMVPIIFFVVIWMYGILISKKVDVKNIPKIKGQSVVENVNCQSKDRNDMTIIDSDNRILSVEMSSYRTLSHFGTAVTNPIQPPTIV